MKYIFIFFFFGFFISSQFLNAQTDKGNWVAGIASTFSSSGNNSVLGFGYTSRKFDDQTNTSEIFQFNFTPRVGYLISNNLMLALNVNLSYFDNDGSANKFIGAGPLVRYYFKGRLRPFIEINGSYGFSNISSLGGFRGDQDFNLNHLLMGGSLGLAIPIKEFLHLDLATTYNYQIINFIEDDFSSTEHNLGFKIGVTLFFDSLKK